VIFDALGTEELARIVDIQLKRLNQRLADRRISVEVTQAGKDWLALTGFDPVYGARPLKRLVQTTIEDALARKVLSGEVTDGDTVHFDVNPEGGLEVVEHAEVV
jgi:ATP-dependent Clp protease ATP-binding subunit ClpB